MSLYNEEVGMWEYNMSGVGLRLGLMDPTRIAATLGSDGSSFISWRNPFVDPVKVLLAYGCMPPCTCIWCNLYCAASQQLHSEGIETAQSLDAAANIAYGGCLQKFSS